MPSQENYSMLCFFSRQDDNAHQAVQSMPNVFRYGVNALVKALADPITNGLKSILLFGIIESLPKVNITSFKSQKIIEW